MSPLMARFIDLAQQYKATARGSGEGGRALQALCAFVERAILEAPELFQPQRQHIEVTDTATITDDAAGKRRVSVSVEDGAGTSDR